MNIGPHELRNNVFVAPMAGVTDRPFRQLCKELGAGYAVSEMAASNPRLWASEKSSRRTDHTGEMEPKAVQIAGAVPEELAECAKFNVDRGAQIIDINMGCPVKKVCNNWCGSALLQHEDLVQRILEAVVPAVNVPVTLKFRTGWNRENKNALRIARIAEQAGIQMLTLHGRTRADGYTGDAEYDTIAAVKAAVKIPVVANGDITTPEKARYVLDKTGADAVMIGRAAQGRPWIFREIDHFLRTGEHLPAPLVAEVRKLMDEHLQAHYAFYGEFLGVRTARKHIGWYVRDLPGGEEFRQEMNRLESTAEQLRAV
ncbi:MAG TPA: tRNA dihydrouridine synthase DusB, partial [Pseudoduganella sp.]